MIDANFGIVGYLDCYYSNALEKFRAFSFSRYRTVAYAWTRIQKNYRLLIRHQAGKQLEKKYCSELRFY